ncbi:MAG TPA: amino acid adenylation domain-containing protein, partial [Candidatus Deferrimicrobium sp.]|nr:amino acid adenylation domain-containing protein [Candidatus Deferrimicrobium sp.]
VIESGTGYVAPRDEVETKLVEIWSEVLQIPETGIDDHFFRLGGHSLKATALVAKIHKELDVKVPLAEIFKSPTVRGLAGYIKHAAAERYMRIWAVEKKEYYVLSPAQKRLYFLQQMELGSTVYNMSAVMELTGWVDREKLQATFQRLIERHESLRTSFMITGEEPVQKIHTKSFAELFQKRLPEGPPPGGGTLLSFIRPFDLSKAPLLRIGLLEKAETEFLLIVDMHHIISDGTSMGILIKEFMALYEGKELFPLNIHYKDYAEWQGKEKNREARLAQETFWLGQFAEEIPVLNLPTDYTRPVVQDFAGNHYTFELTAAETSALKERALGQGVTLYMLLLAVCNAWLARLSGEEDIIIGTPVAGRRHEELQGIVGMFVNTLALRNFPAPGKSFDNFLKEIKERTLVAFQDQDYPFEELVDRVVKNRDTARNPLFDVMFVFQNMDTPEIQIPGLSIKPHEFENKTAKFDLNLEGMEEKDRLCFNLEYSTRLFKEETARRFCGYFKNMVNDIIENPAVRIIDIEIMGKEEKERILEMATGDEETIDAGETVHGWFAKVVLKNEDQTALVFRDGRLTYGEVNHRADKLAGLLQDHGAGRDSIVGLMAARSFELVIAMLGIMKAGGAYLPIDPKFPPERIDYMLKDSGAKLLITTNDKDDFIIQSHFLSFHHSSFIIHHSNLCYLIYTSGSTGKPKGVMLEHTNLVNLITFHHRCTGIDCTKVLQFATISFDASFHEIFSALLARGELVLVDEETKNNIPALFAAIIKDKLKTLFLPMAILKLIFSHDEYINTFPRSVTHIQTAGEQVVVDRRFRDFLKTAGIALHNHYGPSETHVITTFTMNPEEDIPEFPPIGKPVMNTCIYILDKGNHFVPMGVAGELYAGGLQVGRGYVNNPELTAEKFKNKKLKIKNEKLKSKNGDALRANLCHSILYHTGDLARWLADGNIEFLGRIDHQVKIRGIRVEPGEIESLLKKIENVKDAVVTVKQDANNEKFLCAYVVLENGIELDVPRLRNLLAKELPEYMIPAYFVPLPKIPLTTQGKLDRHGLPEPGITKTEKTYAAPRNPIEKELVEIWAAVLGTGKENIGIDDNFFYLGGHSLKALILSARIHKNLNVNVPVTEIFRAPVLKDLAQYIEHIENRAGHREYISITPAEKKEYYRLSAAQERLYVIQQMDPGSTVYNIPARITLLGELDRVRFAATFKKIIQRQESLCTSFHMIDEEPVQKIHDRVNFEIEYDDSPCRLEEIITNFVRPFNLETAPLLRVSLIKESAQKHTFLIDMNHIISDGVSIGILEKEFMALLAGKEPEPLRIQYHDWAQWQKQEKNNDRLKNQESYWLKEFAGKIPVLNLPYDYIRPSARDFAGKRVTWALPAGETESLNTLARQEEVTLYMLLLSAYYVLLYKLTGQEDMIIGAPTAGRFREELQPIIGMFLNTLALRNSPAGVKPFKQFLNEVKTKVLNAFENQAYQFDDLVDRLGAQRGDGRNPLFDAMFILQNLDKTEIRIPGLELRNIELEYTTAKFDLSLYAEEVGPALQCNIAYREKLFSRATVTTIAEYFKTILTSIIKNPNRALADLDILPD